MLISPSPLVTLSMCVVMCVGSGIVGWKVRGWNEDSKELAAHSAVMETQRLVAISLEEKLQKLRENERTVVRETTKVVERSVYRNVCLDPDGVRLINAAKEGKASGASQPLTEMP